MALSICHAELTLLFAQQTCAQFAVPSTAQGTESWCQRWLPVIVEQDPGSP